MACRQTEYVRRERALLIERLGGVCVKCSTTDKLEFDHIHGKDYESRKLSSSARMARYKREADAGEIQLLCGDCNKKARKRNDNGKFVPTNSNPPITDNIPF